MPQLSVSNSTIDVMNAALVEIGVPKITSFSESNIRAQTGNLMFLDALEEAVSAYRWRFAAAVPTLSALSDPPPGWESVWQIPAEAVVVHCLYSNGTKIKFDIYGTGIVAPYSIDEMGVVQAEISQITTPDKWPGYFRKAFILHLAAAICMPITQDERFSTQLEQKAMSRMRTAMSRDAQSRSPRVLDTKAFIRNRRSYGRFG